MPNILLTNKCNQKCLYCFARNEFKKPIQEMKLSDFINVLEFFKKSNYCHARLMGGEPTMHPEFKTIIDFCLKNNFKTQVFTNGIFSEDLLLFLKSKEDKIKYSFNLNLPEFYTQKTWQVINRNIKELSRYNRYKSNLIGAVVSGLNFKIDYLLDIARKYNISNIALRPDSDCSGKENRKKIIKSIIRELGKINREEFNVCYGCGLDKDLISKNEKTFLQEYSNQELKFGCDANSGKFDIAVDLTVFRCFPLLNWKPKKLFDFSNVLEIEEYFNKS